MTFYAFETQVPLAKSVLKMLFRTFQYCEILGKRTRDLSNRDLQRRLLCLCKISLELAVTERYGTNESIN